jgi:hypothetical protein
VRPVQVARRSQVDWSEPMHEKMTSAQTSRHQSIRPHRCAATSERYVTVTLLAPSRYSQMPCRTRVVPLPRAIQPLLDSWIIEIMHELYCTVSLLWDSMFDVQPGGASSYSP